MTTTPLTQQLTDNIKTHRDVFVKYLAYVLRNDADAEDVFQDACIYMYENIHQFKGKSALRTWMWRVCLNRLHTFLLLEVGKRAEVFVDDEWADHPVDDHLTHLEKTEDTRRLSELLDEMPAHTKDVFEKWVLDDIPMCELVEELGKNPKYVYNKVAGGKEWLKSKLK